MNANQYSNEYVSGWDPIAYIRRYGLPFLGDVDTAWEHYQKVGRQRGYFPGADDAQNVPIQRYLDQVVQRPDGRVYVEFANGLRLELTNTLKQLRDHPKGLLPVTLTMEWLNRQNNENRVYSFHTKKKINTKVIKDGRWI